MLEINYDLKSLIPALQKEEYELLEKSILEEGCRDSIIIWNNTIVDGHNRYEICTKHEIPFNTTSMEFENVEQVKEWMINNQFSRRNLPLYQRAVLALKLKPIYEERAKNNMSVGGKIKNEPLATLPNPEYKSIIPINTRKELSIQSGVGERTISKVEKIEEKATPEIKQKIANGEISINKAYTDIKREENKIKVAVEVNNIPIPEGKFNIIYCDPPWRYQFAETNSRAIENQYPTMKLEDIKMLDIPADENAVLYMWATAPKLQEALEVIEAWGFEYRTCAVWDKEIIGMGYWFRGQHEILMVAVKGKFSPPTPENRYSSVIRERRTKHSKKPLILYEMIESMYPNGKYIELFSRNKHNERWEVWGNQL